MSSKKMQGELSWKREGEEDKRKSNTQRNDEWKKHFTFFIRSLSLFVSCQFMGGGCFPTVCILQESQNEVSELLKMLLRCISEEQPPHSVCAQRFPYQLVQGGLREEYLLGALASWGTANGVEGSAVWHSNHFGLCSVQLSTVALHRQELSCRNIMLLCFCFFQC